MRPARTIADLRAVFAQGHEQLRRAPTARIAAPPEAAAPPAPGTLAALEAEIRQRGERDLRHPARRAVDEIWERAQQDVERRFGRRLPTDPWDAESDGAAVALRAAHAAEATFLTIATGARPLPAACDDARAVFHSAVAAYLNATVAGWPSAAVHRAQQQAERDWWAR